MAVNWSDSETFKLIELWSEEGVQEQLEGSKRNKHVYARLSSELEKHGIVKSGEQCRGKVKKLRQEYKKIKDGHNQTGRGRTKWKFYDQLNELLGNRPATRPPVVLETLESNCVSVEEVCKDMSEDEMGSEGTLESSQVDTPTSRDDSLSQPGSSREKEPASGSYETPERKTGSKGKKRKRSKGEVLEDVMRKVMKTVTEGMKESDKMLLEFEKERMKFEEQQKREERQFQLQMMQLLMGPSHQNRTPDPHAQYFPAMYTGYPGVPHSQYYPHDTDSS